MGRHNILRFKLKGNNRRKSLHNLRYAIGIHDEKKIMAKTINKRLRHPEKLPGSRSSPYPAKGAQA